MWQKIVSLTTDRRAFSRFILLSIIVVALSLGGIALYKYLLDPAHAFPDEDWHLCFDKDTVNLVLLGFDRNAARDKHYRIYRPDTIMIASINFRKASVAIVNIPRDSYVKINGEEGYDKINHSYMHGYVRPGVEDPHRSGIDTVLKTIEDFLGGIPVHYYVSLDMDGVAEIVDQLGGFYYDVDVEVRSEMGRGRLLLKKGYQHLDGKKFLYYVRDRSTGGDLGRAQRQQQIMIAAFKQLRKQGRLNELPALYRTLTENVETNLSLRQITSLAVFGARVDPATIKTYVFPGEMQCAPSGNIDALNYWVIDEKARVKLIKEIFGVKVARRPQITLPGPRKMVVPASKNEGTSSKPLPTELIPSDHRGKTP